MTNEEAFEKWFENTVLNDNIHDVSQWAWQAAIAYMQEQGKLAEQSEPVYLATDGECNWYEISEKRYKEIMSDDDKKILYTTPQRQQPLKRLSQLDVLKILNECAKSPYTNTQSSFGFADAIMNAMQEINK